MMFKMSLPSLTRSFMLTAVRYLEAVDQQSSVQLHKLLIPLFRFKHFFTV